MVCLLNSCLYVISRSYFESLASVVPIKLVRSAAHYGAPRIAVRRALRHTVRTWAVVGKNDWQFSNPRIDTVHMESSGQRKEGNSTRDGKHHRSGNENPN